MVSATPYPTPIPRPTSTPIPSITPTPGATPGAVGDEKRLVVTIIDEGIKSTVDAVYASQHPPTLNQPPKVTMGYNGHVEITLVFYNDFLDQETEATVEALASVQNGLILLEEIVPARQVNGPDVSEASIRAGLTLVEVGLNRAVMEMAQQRAGSTPLSTVLVYPGYLVATFESR